MAEQLVNTKLYMGPYELSGYMNAAALAMKAESKECTTLPDTAKRFLGGLLGTTVELNGFWQAEAVTGNPHAFLFNQMALANKPLSICPTTGADGELVLFYQPLLAEYSPGAKVGEIMVFKVHADGTGPVVSGTIMIPKGPQTVSGNGTVRQLGAVLAAQKLYAALHVFAKSGTPSLVVKIQSHDDSAFGVPIDQITFATATDLTSEFKSLAGPITDTWWRVNFTISGGTPSITFAVMVAML